MQQLPGYSALPSGRTRSTGWLLIIAFLVAGGVVALRLAPSILTRPTNATPEAVPRQIQLSTTQIEDILHHLEAAFGRNADATAALRESERVLNLALPYVDDQPIVSRRFRSVRSMQRSASSQIIRSQEELDVVRSILIERSNKP